MKEIIQADNEIELTYEDLSWLSNTKRAIKLFKSKKLADSTIKSYYNSISIVLNAEGENELSNRYGALRDELNKKYVKEQSTGIISEKQAPNFVSKEAFEKMISDIEGIENKTLSEIQLLLLLKLYQENPSRNELAEFTKVSKDKYNKELRGVKDTNFVVIRKKRVVFIVNNYKTKDKYGRYRIMLPSSSVLLVKEMIKKQEEKFKDLEYNKDSLFLNDSGNPLTKNNLTKILTRASEKYIEGSPKISTTMIRKIYASDLSAEKNVKAQKLANKMNHSMDVHNQIYVKSKKSDD